MENPKWNEETFPNYNNIDVLKDRLKRQMKTREHETESSKSKMGFVCSHCKKEIELPYYKCRYHGNVFCFSCATKMGEFKSEDFPKCKEQRLDKKECIWQKYG